MNYSARRKRSTTIKKAPLFSSSLIRQWSIADTTKIDFSGPDKKTPEDSILDNVDRSCLFSKPGAREDCSICCVALPQFDKCQYQSCCGNILCLGCIVGVAEKQLEKNMIKGTDRLPLCPFCRTPAATSVEQAIDRLQRRVNTDPNDHHALFILGSLLCDDEYGQILPQDVDRGIKVLRQSCKLGNIDACAYLGCAFNPLSRRVYRGVEKNLLTSIRYYEQAAIGGHMWSRYNLAVCHDRFYFDIDTTKKHLIMAANQGHDLALDDVKRAYMNGVVEKDEYASALRAHYQSKTDLRSDQRTDAEEKVGDRNVSDRWVVF